MEVARGSIPVGIGDDGSSGGDIERRGREEVAPWAEVGGERFRKLCVDT